jgi:hypothetical protein
MEPSEIAKQTLELSRAAVDNTCCTMLLLQDQAQRAIDIYLHQMLVFPQEGKRIVDAWMEAGRINREEFKKVAEKSYEMVASLVKDDEEKTQS